MSGDKGLYIYATMVSRNEPGKVVTSSVQGYRFANNEDEARGMAVAYTIAQKPDFGIDQVLVMRVDDQHILNAAQAIEAQRAATENTGAVADESAVREANAPILSSKG